MSDSTTERWKPVPGHPGYEVSDCGRVRSVDRVRLYPGGYTKSLRGKVLRPSHDKTGRARIPLPLPDGGTKMWQIHALVLTAFVGPRPDEATDGCHNNGNCTDNRLTNLRWDTKSGNMMDTIQHGTHFNASKTHCAHGHEFTPENTIQRKSSGRGCRECTRKAIRESMRRRRAAERAA